MPKTIPAEGVIAEVYRGSWPAWTHTRKQRWRFRLLDAGNHKVLASSEAYTNKQDAIETASRLASEIVVKE